MNKQEQREFGAWLCVINTLVVYVIVVLGGVFIPALDGPLGRLLVAITLSAIGVVAYCYDRRFVRILAEGRR